MADDPLESHLQSLLVQPSSSSKTLDLDLEQDQRGSREALQASLDALGAYEPSASDSLRELDTEYGGVQSASGSSSLWNALYDAAQADLNREDVVQSYSEEMEPEAAIEATSGTPVARLRQ